MKMPKKISSGRVAKIETCMADTTSLSFMVKSPWLAGLGQHIAGNVGGRLRASSARLARRARCRQLLDVGAEALQVRKQGNDLLLLQTGRATLRLDLTADFARLGVGHA